MAPVSVSVSSGITIIFLVIGTKAKFKYSIVLQTVNLVKNEVFGMKAHSKSIKNFIKRSNT